MNRVSMSLCGIALTAQAFYVNAAAPSEATTKECAALSEMAHNIMEARQQETSMAKLLAIKTGDSQLDELAATMTKDAYAQSAYSSPDNQKKAAREFENHWFSACLKSRTAQ